jgi:hypothetical protein
VAGLIANYVRHVKDKTGSLGTWEPGRRFAVGDIVVWSAREGFTRETTLQKWFEKLAAGKGSYYDMPPVDGGRRERGKEGYAFGASYSLAGSLGARAAGVPGTGGALGTQVSFSGSGSFLMLLTNRRTRSFANLADVRDLLKQLRLNRDWRKRWGVVTEVVEVQEATVVVAERSKAAIRLEADIEIRSAADLKATTGFTASRDSGAVDFFVLHACTPLMKVMALSRPFGVGPVRAQSVRPARRIGRRLATAKRTATKRATAKRTAAKRTAAKRTAAKRTTAKRATTKRTTAKRTTAKRATAKRTTATTAKRTAAQRMAVPASAPAAAGP